MKNRKNFKILGGVVLTLVLVAILSITYATYTKTLEITGAGTLKGAKWEIKFKGDGGSSDVTVTKESEETGYESDVKEGTVSVNGTTLNIINAELKRPGDSITYEFEVDNTGDFDAILNNATVTLQCSNIENDNENTEECKKHIKVSLLDKIGQTLAESDGDTSYNNDASAEHKLMHTAGNTEKFKLKIEYKPDNLATGANLPKDDIVITEFGATLNYKQYTTN